MLRKCHGHGLTNEAIIQIFYHGLEEPTQGILDAIKSKNEHHQKSVSFADGSDSNTDNSRFVEKLKAMDSKVISLNEELQDMREKYNELGEGNASKNDVTSMSERHEANYIQSEVSNMFVKNNVKDMILKMKQNEKNFQTIFKNMEIKIDEWEKSQNISLEQTDRTEPQPPPQAHTEHVNVVFTGSGKSNDSPKTQKDTLPSIIVNNKIKKDRPIKKSKKSYHVVKTKEYPFREYIPKIPYPQAFRVDHSHLNRIIKES
ncbi:hypothetical protein Tco_1544540 [Tanacetum coccineum]